MIAIMISHHNNHRSVMIFMMRDHDRAMIILKIKVIHGGTLSGSFICLLDPRGFQSHKSQKINIAKNNFQSLFYRYNSPEQFFLVI